jgi:hypothetical protein
MWVRPFSREFPSPSHIYFSAMCELRCGTKVGFAVYEKAITGEFHQPCWLGMHPVLIGATRRRLPPVLHSHLHLLFIFIMRC